MHDLTSKRYIFKGNTPQFHGEIAGLNVTNFSHLKEREMAMVTSCNFHTIQQYDLFISRVSNQSSDSLLKTFNCKDMI